MHAIWSNDMDELHMVDSLMQLIVFIHWLFTNCAMEEDLGCAAVYYFMA